MSCTLRELIFELQEIITEEPKMADAIIIQSHDSEGNQYSPLDEIGIGKYRVDSDEMVYRGYGDYEDGDLVDAVCLRPVN